MATVTHLIWRWLVLVSQSWHQLWCLPQMVSGLHYEKYVTLNFTDWSLKIFGKALQMLAKDHNWPLSPGEEGWWWWWTLWQNSSKHGCTVPRHYKKVRLNFVIWWFVALDKINSLCISKLPLIKLNFSDKLGAFGRLEWFILGLVTENNCKMESFKSCTLHEILLVQSNQGWDRWGM